MPRQLVRDVDARRRAGFARSTIWATSRRGMRSVTTTISLIPFSSASRTASLVNAGGTVTTEPSGTAPACSTTCATVSKTSTPWTSRPFLPGRDTADDLRPVVQALAGEVHGFPPRDSLDDEGGVAGKKDAHPRNLLHSTPRSLCMETERSQYSMPYSSRILNPSSSSQAPGMRKIAIVSAGLCSARGRP